MYEFLSYRVADVMTANPITVARETTLADAGVIFDTHAFNGLPVVDREQHLVGVFTKLDVLKAFAFTPQSVVPAYDEIMRQPIERLMTVDPVTVAPDTPLTRVLQCMVDARCKSIPVIEGGKLVGIIAREDILRALRRAVAGGGPVPPSSTPSA